MWTDLEGIPPDHKERRTAFQRALDVEYHSLPDNAQSAPKAKAPVQATAPKVEVIRSGTRVQCYLVRSPSPVFFISFPKVWDALKKSMPTLERSQCLTLKEAKSFMTLEGEKVTSLRQAAEWWASDAPPELGMPGPVPQDNDAPPWDVDAFGYVI